MKERVPLKVRIEYAYIPAREMELRIKKVNRIIAEALERQRDAATNNPPKDKG